MRLESFFEKFELFADAPNAMAKMRELVVDLAIRGKLVQNNPEERPVRLNMSADSGNNSIPQNWRSGVLGDAITLEYGDNLPAGKRSGSGDYPVYGSNGIVGTHDSFLTEEPAIIVGRKGSAGALNIANGPSWTTDVAYFVHPPSDLDLRFTYYLLSSLHLDELGKGIKPGLSRKEAYVLPISLPPLAEQKRIVAKVDELMALCDRLEAQQQERDTRHAALARASLARFAEAPTSANLDLLFHKSYAITPADLRKTILTLAVQGKLVPQASNDEPVVELLKKLAQAKTLAKKRDSSRARSSNAIDLAMEYPYEIPESWAWVPLNNIGAVSGGMTPSKAKAGYWGGDMNWFSPKDIKSDELFNSELKITSAGVVATGLQIYPPGCLFMVARSGILKRTFPVSINRVQATANQDLKVLTPFISGMERYLQIMFRGMTDFILTSLVKTGMTVQSLKYEEFETQAFPLPPLAEQHRIVAKVDQLMILVDQLETQLTASRATAGKLLEAMAAELAGTDRDTDQNLPLRNATTMKIKSNVATSSLTSAEPLTNTTQRFVLRRFAMGSGYRSLGEFDYAFHPITENVDEASPVCLVGLNGSGKSNLIEAIAEVFCFLELINLPWKKLVSSSSRYRSNRHRFELEYTIGDDRGERLVRIRKNKKNGAEFFLVSDDGTETPVEPGREQLLLLPRRIIGYSSGLNETVSHPFLRTKTIYSEEVRDSAPQEGIESPRGDTVFDTRTLYMDYESNAAIIISNYIFRQPEDLAVFEEFTRVKGVSSFGLRFNRKRAGKSGVNSIVRLTSELQSFLKSFALCAGMKYEESEVIAFSFEFELTPETMALFRQEFKTAENLFMAMHKWSLLNALILSDEQRKVYLSSDITKGALERPPSVPPSDRVFDIVNLKLQLSQPAIEIDYSGLSDGEHQFIQVFGTALLFSEPGTLFLFDEPESHFNPEWRTKFNLILNRLPNAGRQEYVISTHSPYLVSGSRQGNVYKFTRVGGGIKCDPVDFETYGATFDVLLKKLFSIDSLIDQSARQGLEQIIQRGDVAEMQDAVEDFAESREKRRLYEAIIRKTEGK